MKISQISSAALFTLLALSAEAQLLDVNKINYGGTGCPAGTISTLSNSKSNTVQLLPQQMIAEAGTNGKRMDRKACSISIPVQAPKGYRVALLSHSVSAIEVQSGSLNYQQEVFLVGTKNKVLKKSFDKPTKVVLNTERESLRQPILWSGCGESTILRANLSTVAQGTARAQTSSIGLRMLLKACR